jgi:hypothetical protein
VDELAATMNTSIKKNIAEGGRFNIALCQYYIQDTLKQVKANTTSQQRI